MIARAERPRYEGIGMPVLMLVGDEDKTSPLESCEGILRAWGMDADGQGEGREDKRMVVLKGVGHWFCVEDPEAVGGAVKGFLESVG